MMATFTSQICEIMLTCKFTPPLNSLFLPVCAIRLFILFGVGSDFDIARMVFTAPYFALLGALTILIMKTTFLALV